MTTTDSNLSKPAAAGKGLPHIDQKVKKPEPPSEPPPAKDAQLVPEPPLDQRLAAIQATRNPLLEAAQPLLRALADMPADLSPDRVTVLHRLLVRDVTTFQLLCSKAQIKHEHAVAASYVLCTALDERASSTAWGGGKGRDAGVWATQPLAAQFHGDIEGGDKFFLLVGRLAAHPQEHIGLLEVMYMILGLGFEGRFRAPADGRRQLETIRHRLLAILNAERGEVPRELSPHWKGQGAGSFRLLRSIPVWVTVSVLGLTLFALFAWYKYQLLAISAQLEQHIAQIGAMRAPPPPVLAAKPLRLKELLGAEIERGTVSVDENERRSAVTFQGDDMFGAGKVRLSDKVVPVLAKVAHEIRQVKGSVEVVGHTDSLPIKTREFPNNQVLSEKRAAAVAQVLQDEGVDPSRLQVQGKGDTVPIADNQSSVGRSRNRRVDIVVTQGAPVSQGGQTGQAGQAAR